VSAAVHDPTLYNEDLAPVPKARRTWGLYNYASLWVAMSVCIPTYMLASGLIAGGMSWWQAIATILLGNLIVLVPMLLNAHAGAKYIPKAPTTRMFSTPSSSPNEPLATAISSTPYNTDNRNLAHAAHPCLTVRPYSTVKALIQDFHFATLARRGQCFQCPEASSNFELTSILLRITSNTLRYRSRRKFVPGERTISHMCFRKKTIMSR